MSSANLNNWMTSPHSQWAFQNVDKLIPTNQIKKSSSPSTLGKETSAAIDGLEIAKDGKQTLDIKALLEQTQTDGFVLLHRGKILYEFYGNGNTEDSKHIIMSITKSVTGLIVGALIDRGLLHADDKVIQHLPEMKDTAFAPATIQHLLDMRSGIIYEDHPHEYRVHSGWESAESGEEQLDLATFLSSFRPPETKPPPADFVYASVNTDTLGLLVERVTGKSFAQLVHELVWEPAGAEHDAIITVDKAGNAKAAGGMCTSIRDLARLGQGLIDGKLASKAWLDDMLYGGEIEPFKTSIWGPGFEAFCPTLAYRSDWLVSGDEKILIGLGIHGQHLVVDLKNEIVIAKQSSQPVDMDMGSINLALQLFRAIQHAVA